MTWRHHKLTALKSHGINGRILNYIQLFLQDRSFQVNFNGCKSSKKLQENGIPQGEVISVTLFLVAINDILQQIFSDIKALCMLTT